MTVLLFKLPAFTPMSCNFPHFPRIFFLMQAHSKWNRTKKLLRFSSPFSMFIAFISLGLVHLQFVSHLQPVLPSLSVCPVSLGIPLSFTTLITSSWPVPLEQHLAFLLYVQHLPRDVAWNLWKSPLSFEMLLSDNSAA